MKSPWDSQVPGWTEPRREWRKPESHHLFGFFEMYHPLENKHDMGEQSTIFNRIPTYYIFIRATFFQPSSCQVFLGDMSLVAGDLSLADFLWQGIALKWPILYSDLWEFLFLVSKDPDFIIPNQAVKHQQYQVWYGWRFRNPIPNSQPPFGWC